MSNAAWKDYERWVSKHMGGQRRGADYVSEDGSGKNDVILEGWSIECKLVKDTRPNVMRKALEQAEAATQTDQDRAVAFISKAGSPYSQSIAIMRLDQFLYLVETLSDKWCINGYSDGTVCILMRADDFCRLVNPTDNKS